MQCSVLCPATVKHCSLVTYVCPIARAVQYRILCPAAPPDTVQCSLSCHRQTLQFSDLCMSQCNAWTVHCSVHCPAVRTLHCSVLCPAVRVQCSVLCPAVRTVQCSVARHCATDSFGGGGRVMMTAPATSFFLPRLCGCEFSGKWLAAPLTPR